MRSEQMTAAHDLSRVYGAIAEWILYPEEIDAETLTPQATEATLRSAAAVSPAVEERLRRFLDERGEVDAEDYVNLFELSPKCPLYLGTHQFEEPKTCSSAGLSDRNTYMLEIANIYRHFGVELSGELPDFLPAMIEFVALSAGRPEHDEEVRLRLIDKLMLEGVRLVVERLDETGAPQRHLVHALQDCLVAEVAARGEVDLVGAAAGEPLTVIQIEEVPAHG
ncbi:MAG: molecular chaperone TorD family protein [Solirubrobacteraceae bacterium]|jgi:nitrate reductase delta subunit|nr:molecular chaperone TorD family protein [Solirubrobacteraceae bacterium]